MCCTHVEGKLKSVIVQVCVWVGGGSEGVCTA